MKVVCLGLAWPHTMISLDISTGKNNLEKKKKMEEVRYLKGMEFDVGKHLFERKFLRKRQHSADIFAEMCIIWFEIRAIIF